MSEYRGTAREFGSFLTRTVGHVGYLIGARGELCTPARRAQAAKDYPDQAGKIALAAKWDGLPVGDCMGWEEMYENGGDVGKPVVVFKYPDRRTYADYSAAIAMGLPNGPIGTLPKDMPELPIAVGYSGHVGYFYRGMVYQSAGHISGTIVTALGYVVPGLKAWEYWYQMPYLEYEEDVTMKPGDKNPNVGLWQLGLDDAGYWPAGIVHNDNFGPTTTKCTNDFKRDQGLPQDGIVDETTFCRMIDLLRTNGDKTEAKLKATEESLVIIKQDNLALEAENTRLEADLKAGKDGVNGLIGWAAK